MVADDEHDSVHRDLDTWTAVLPGVRPDVEAARQRIRRISRLFDQVLAAAAAEHDMTVGDWEPLSVLRRSAPPHELSPTQLAATLGVTSGTMSVRIERLVRAGLVEPAPSGTDGRSRPVRLTRRGRDRWRTATAHRLRREQDLLAGTLDDTELAALNGLLARLLHRFEAEFGPAPTHGTPGAAPPERNHRTRTANT